MHGSGLLVASALGHFPSTNFCKLAPVPDRAPAPAPASALVYLIRAIVGLWCIGLYTHSQCCALIECNVWYVHPQSVVWGLVLVLLVCVGVCVGVGVGVVWVWPTAENFRALVHKIGNLRSQTFPKCNIYVVK